jgi:hypothetical protein
MRLEKSNFYNSPKQNRGSGEEKRKEKRYMEKRAKGCEKKLNFGGFLGVLYPQRR